MDHILHPSASDTGQTMRLVYRRSEPVRCERREERGKGGGGGRTLRSACICSLVLTPCCGMEVSAWASTHHVRVAGGKRLAASLSAAPPASWQSSGARTPSIAPRHDCRNRRLFSRQCELLRPAAAAHAPSVKPGQGACPSAQIRAYTHPDISIRARYWSTAHCTGATPPYTCIKSSLCIDYNMSTVEAQASLAAPAIYRTKRRRSAFCFSSRMCGL